MSNDNHWFYLEGEERKGPVDIDVMRQLLQAGAIQPVTWVAREGDEQWRPAEEALGSVVNLRKVVDVPDSNPPKDHLGDWRILLWAGIPLLAYFAWGLVMRHYQCELRHPGGQLIPRILSRDVIGLIEMVEPKSLFNWNAELGGVLVLFAGCVLAALGLSRLHTFRAGFLVQKQPAPGWTIGVLWLTWVAVVVGCFIVTYFSPTWRGHILFTTLPLNGAGSRTGLVVSTVVILTIIAFAVISVLRANKQLGVARRRGGISPLFLLLAAGVGKITVVLASLVLIHSVLLTATVKRSKNPDLLTAYQLLQAISKYQQQHGDQFITEWTKVHLPMGSGDIYQPWDTIVIPDIPKPFCGTVRPNGDIEGTSEGRLVALLSRTETTQDNPDGGGYLPAIYQGAESIVDAWNSRPFHIAVDGNGDGRVTVGNREITARIVVWSDGWNGQDEFGEGDDVIRKLK